MSQRKLKEIFGNLNETMSKEVQPNLSKPNLYKICCVASFSKLVEFNLYLTSRRRKYSFFLLGTLRGLCEELIFLSYLQTFPYYVRNSILRERMKVSTLRGIAAQTKFFSVSEFKQLVLMYPKSHTKQAISDHRSKLNEIISRHSTFSQLPTLKIMADQTGYGELYAYLYHGTSRLVHFDPAVLLRMGWGPSLAGPYRFSTEHFEDYYLDFCRAYSSMLFVEFVRKFGRSIGSENIDLKAAAHDVSQVLKQRKRLPELVTFEEMNVDIDEMPALIEVALNAAIAQSEFEESDEN